MGTLGYLTEVEVQNLFPALDQLLEGSYTVENRMMLSGTVKDFRTDVALNDIVVTRSENLHIVRLNLYVNGVYLTSYQADGLSFPRRRDPQLTTCRQADRLWNRRRP